MTYTMLTADTIKTLLDLEPLPREGGFYRETYRSADSAPSSDGIVSGRNHRRLSSAIYYLLTFDEHSSLHSLPGDEIYHFYLGDAVEMLQLHPDGTSEIVRIGTDIAEGQRPQVRVPGGTWQGCRLASGGRFALLGTTMAPGFEFSDYTSCDADDLMEQYPDRSEIIKALI